jgi:hypothetical protein
MNQVIDFVLNGRLTVLGSTCRVIVLEFNGIGNYVDPLMGQSFLNAGYK